MASLIFCMGMSGAVLQILLLMSGVLVSAQLAKVERKDPMHAMEKEMEDKKKNEAPAMDPTGKHPLKKLGAKPLVCSACKLTMVRFQSTVARPMKGKWDEPKKRQFFEENLANVCTFPGQMAILEQGRGKVYVDFQDMLTDGAPLGRTFQQVFEEKTKLIQRMDDGVKTEIVTACKFILEEEFKQELLDKFLVKSRPNGIDIDFTGFICGKRLEVCDMEEDFPPEEDAPSEEL